MISIVLGTRPEIIKFSPVIRELENRDIDFLLFIRVNTIPIIWIGCFLSS